MRLSPKFTGNWDQDGAQIDEEVEWVGEGFGHSEVRTLLQV